MEAELHLQFKKHRSEGRHCSARCFKKTAKKNQKEKDSDSTFIVSHRWFYLFLKRWKLTPRKKSNTKQGSVLDRIPFIREFHRKFRLFLSLGTQNHRKWGRFHPNARFNVDQVPLPFVCEQDQTYEEKGQNEFGSDKWKKAWRKDFARFSCVSDQKGHSLNPQLFFEDEVCVCLSWNEKHGTNEWQ